MTRTDIMSNETWVKVKVGEGKVSVQDGRKVYTANILNPSPIKPGKPIVLDRLVHKPGFRAEGWFFHGCYVTELWPESGSQTEEGHNDTTPQPYGKPKKGDKQHGNH